MIEISQFSGIWVVIKFCVLSNMIIAITVIKNENIIELLGKQTNKAGFSPLLSSIDSLFYNWLYLHGD